MNLFTLKYMSDKQKNHKVSQIVIDRERKRGGKMIMNMNKEIKSFVEKKYRGTLFSQYIETEVIEKDPMKIENDGFIQGFHFYDREFITVEGKRYASEKYNCSNWIYFGKRLSLNEFKNQYSNNSDYESLISNIEKSDCQDVCHTQDDSFLPMNKEDMTFNEFVLESISKRKEQEKAKAKAVLDKLRKHLYEEVSCTWWWYGTKQEMTGTIDDIEDFVFVGINGTMIPFVAANMALSEITSPNGEILYLNPYIEDGYNKESTTSIYKIQRLIFGNEIPCAEITKKWEKYKEDDKKAITYIKNSILLADSLMYLIKTEMIKQWSYFVDNNCNELYSTMVVEAVYEMLLKIDNFVPFEEAEQEIYKEKYSLSGYMIEAAANAVSYFSKRGEEYRAYWNEQYSIGNSRIKRNRII